MYLDDDSYLHVPRLLSALEARLSVCWTLTGLPFDHGGPILF